MTQQVTQKESGLAVASMVLGILSLTGFGLFLGIPAIILAAIALKKKDPSRGMSIAGLVTGIISTVLSLLVAAFFVILIIIGANMPSSSDTPNYDNNYSEPRHRI